MENTPALKASARSHFFAVLCSTTFLTVMPLALYVGLVVWAKDIGGMLNFVIIPTASAILGLCVSLAVFLPVSLIAEKLNLGRSRRFVAGVALALSLIVALAWIMGGTSDFKNRELALFSIGASVLLYLVSGLTVYMCSLAFRRHP